MKAFRRRGWAAVLAAALAGCASYSPGGLAPGATADEVMQAMGKPSGEYRLADGGRRLEYARGPFGKQTYMVDLDAQGRMTGWQQVLTEDNFNALRVGMSREQVLERIGHPSEASRIGWQRRTLWSYRYETPFCQWFQVGLDRSDQVVDTGYGPDPMCLANDDATGADFR